MLLPTLRRISRPLALAAIGALLTGCVNLKPRPDTTRFFLLDVTAEAAPTNPGPVIGIREFSLPEYLHTTKIAIRESPWEVGFSERNRWAFDLDRLVPRIFAKALAAETGSAAVHAYPWPPGLEPEFIVTVKMARFEGGQNGSVHFRASATVTRANASPGAPAIHNQATATWESADFATLAEALSEELRVFAREVAGKIK